MDGQLLGGYISRTCTTVAQFIKKAINRDDMFTDIIDIAELTGARHKSMFLVLGELK